MTQIINRTLTDIIDKEAKDYAIYTVENRAIPNMIDGLKPVQRFVLYRALEMGKSDKDKVHKVAAIAGGVADAGYNHGEASAQDACAKMANTWANNVPLLFGEGSFGSRLVQEAAQSRYIHAKVHQNFYDLYKDNDIAPKHIDLDHKPPTYYLPLIPTVLLNGIKGIATGYATNILPHSIQSVIECTKLALKGELNKEPDVAYPLFYGDIIPLGDGRYELHGKYELVSKTVMHIKEIPYKWDRAKYIEKILDPLETNGYITYDDECSKKGFGFKIKFRKDYQFPLDKDKLHEKIMKDFGLIETVSQLITVIDENGQLNDKFKNASELINHFVKVRLSFIDKRIENNIQVCTDKFNTAVRKAKFINDVINEVIILKGKTRKQLLDELSNHELYKDSAQELVQMPLYSITSDEAKKLADTARKLKLDLKYWKETTAQIEYTKDLDTL